MSDLPRYELFHEIGSNPYATVWQAYDDQGQRDVAVMALNSAFHGSPQWDAIWQEVLESIRLKHDYIVAVHDVIEDSGWIVMELMRGNMSQKVAEGPQSVDLVRTVLRRCLEALEFLHEKGKVHGNIKPGTLLYDREGSIKLSFSPGFLVGDQIPADKFDFKYAAPEMLDPSFGQLGPESDLYRLGFSAVELLKGPQFDSMFKNVVNSPDPKMAWMRWHSSRADTLAPIEQSIAGLPQDLATVIGRLLEKDVANRYESAKEALQDLAQQPTDVRVTQVEVQSSQKRSAGPPPSVAPKSSVPAANLVTKPKPKTSAGVGDSINKKLKNPWVMATVVGGILAATVLAAALLSRTGNTPASAKVTLDSVPTGATAIIEIGGKKYQKTTPTTATLKPGQYKVEFQKEGYEPALLSLSIAEDGKFQPPDPVKLKPIALATSGDEKQGVVEVQPPPQGAAETPKLPSGLTPIGSAMDSKSGLPLRATSSRLDGKLEPGDRPLEFVLIEPGEFGFGAEQELAGELSRRTASVEQPLFVMATEVTNAHFGVFAKETNLAGYQPAPRETSNHPVVGISYDQVLAFCQWLADEGRLPSEVEWEYIARSPAGNEYPWGSERPDKSRANILFARAADATLTDVGTLAPGATMAGGEGLQVFDLIGNAAEWCADLYTPGYGETSATIGVGSNHVIRGASFLTVDDDSVRSSWRANIADAGAPDVGFRVVVPAPLKP